MRIKTGRMMDVRITIGDGVAVLRFPNKSEPALAGILGVDRHQDGEIWRVFLDRLIHAPQEREADGWQLSGAISTVLTRTPSADGDASRVYIS